MHIADHGAGPEKKQAQLDSGDAGSGRAAPSTSSNILKPGGCSQLASRRDASLSKCDVACHLGCTVPGATSPPANSLQAGAARVWQRAAFTCFGDAARLSARPSLCVAQSSLISSSRILGRVAPNLSATAQPVRTRILVGLSAQNHTVVTPKPHQRFLARSTVPAAA